MELVCPSRLNLFNLFVIFDYFSQDRLEKFSAKNGAKVDRRGQVLLPVKSETVAFGQKILLIVPE
jgi:hypothetical protein